MDKALILIDLQNEWIDPKSEYFIGSNLKELKDNINILIDFCRKENYKVIFIKHLEQII